MEKSMTTENVTASQQMDAKTLCQQHMYRYVCVWVKDGTMYDGIVEHVDDEKIYLAVPMGGEEMENVNLPYPPNNCGCGSRAYGGYASYPPYPPYPYPYPYPVPVPAYAYGFPYGRRRFNRLILPLAALTAISLLPYY
ncbi:hypothetical protein [Paenibacillus polymyxa]|uniref:hypothetical protein n=1 Tax=Paenibacillus polymyxa TaxID=1406 RepID=UPI0007EA4E5B|nr:hypothetical protein [Paenibacillus polymyxa]OAZ50170.1 hypothetical protein A9Z39_09520 [Paenibacillus polymyxa]